MVRWYTSRMSTYESRCIQHETGSERLVRDGDRPGRASCGTGDVWRVSFGFAVRSSSPSFRGGGTITDRSIRLGTFRASGR